MRKRRLETAYHMSIISLNFRMPLAFITPFTPSGILYAHSATPNGLATCMASSWSGCSESSEVSATSTRPSSLIVSTSAGTTFYGINLLVFDLLGRLS